MNEIDKLKFPIGMFDFDQNKSIEVGISSINNLPNRLNNILEKLPEDHLKWAYRPEGWQICQVVHHISDSHINAFIRMRIACSNSGGQIAPYDEKAWAEFPDSKSTNLENSMEIISSIHRKWVTFLEGLSEQDLNKSYYHPADKVKVTIREAIQMYAWHGEHHFAHIVQGLASKGSY